MILSVILKIYSIVLGVIVLIATMWQLAKRQLLEDVAIIWVIFGIFMIILGVAIPIANLGTLLGPTSFALILLFFAILVATVFRLSLNFSNLHRKNHELSMQVTLLNQENERILHEISTLSTERKGTES